MPDKGDQNPSSSARAREREAGAWQRAWDALPKDELGRHMIGSPKDGCRHCGRVIGSVPEGHNVIVYRPAVECCSGSVLDQLTRLLLDIGLLRERRTFTPYPSVEAELAHAEAELERLRFLLHVLEASQ